MEPSTVRLGSGDAVRIAKRVVPVVRHGHHGCAARGDGDGWVPSAELADVLCCGAEALLAALQHPKEAKRFQTGAIAGFRCARSRYKNSWQLRPLLPPLPRHSDLGQQQADHELAADLLLKHVGPVFRERQILAEDALLVMPYIPAAPANIEWRLDRIQFRELVARPRDGAPGPDGLPYSAWRLAGLEFMDVLFEAYDAFMDGEDLPEGFNDCLVVFIPKGDEPGD